jgi:hypothetical protein
MQVEELQLGVLRVEAGSEQEGGLEAVDLAGLRSLQAVRAITGFSPHDRCAWRQRCDHLPIARVDSFIGSTCLPCSVLLERCLVRLLQ